MAELTLDYIDTSCRHLWLDLRDFTILEVRDDNGDALTFSIDKHDPILGERLNISLLSQTASVNLYYQTSPNAQGLQWLTPEQTSGKSLPFLFSQSQPVNARSWIPLQDSLRPTSRSKQSLCLLARAVMSAMNDATASLCWGLIPEGVMT
ncbi:Peptidase, M1 family protein (fragment) [Shewanella benthica]|uniref:Peptidase, M1 family protein n=1 Tax=Shewanella benthica TaxID=43661 RepID=A0A330M0Q8_9GAMM